MKRLLSSTALIAVVPLLLSSCLFQKGWTDAKKDQLRKELCVENGISSTSSQCSCLVNVVLDFFETPAEFSKSTQPPPGFIERFARC